MAKTLKNLLRLHKWRVDEKQRELGERLRELGELEQMAQDLEDQLIREQKIAAESPNEAGFTYGRFAQFAIQKREQIAAATRQKEQEVDIAREAMGEAFKELKVYEQAQKIRDEKEQAERDRKEQEILDEIGQNLYRRSLNEEES